MSKKLGPAIILLVVIVLLLRSAFFMVDETKQAIVVQLGKPVSGVQGPGIHFKIPFIQDVIEFERRLLDYDASPAEILTADKKNPGCGQLRQVESSGSSAFLSKSAGRARRPKPSGRYHFCRTARRTGASLDGRKSLTPAGAKSWRP